MTGSQRVARLGETALRGTAARLSDGERLPLEERLRVYGDRADDHADVPADLEELRERVPEDLAEDLGGDLEDYDATRRTAGDGDSASEE